MFQNPKAQIISNMTPSLAVDRFNPTNILQPFKIRLPKQNPSSRAGDKMVVLWWLDDEPQVFDDRVIVFNTTFNNISVISWWSVLLVEETGVPRKNH
jgi:hypothetical protein